MAYTNIDLPTDYFNTILYTGTGASNAITVGFQPDFTWIKDRSNARDHQLVNVVVGYPTGTLISNATDAEYTAFPRVDSRDANGFTVSTPAQVNNSGETYVAWNWLANGAGVSNTSGTIASTVSANTTAGFSIVSYTSTGANATVGHGLGATPKMMIFKTRDSADNWPIWHNSFAVNEYVYLNNNNAKASLSTFMNSTLPNSTVISLGTWANVNYSTPITMIAYCFAEVKGYSKFGSYTGNGSTDGTFIYTGFKPAFIMIKRTDSADEWQITDAKRNVTNGANNASLKANSSASETVNSTWTLVDLLSNGFKQRYTDSLMNASGGTYIYMAFAENPFVSSTGIPTTAR